MVCLSCCFFGLIIETRQFVVTVPNLLWSTSFLTFICSISFHFGLDFWSKIISNVPISTTIPVSHLDHVHKTFNLKTKRGDIRLQFKLALEALKKHRCLVVKINTKVTHTVRFWGQRNSAPGVTMALAHKRKQLACLLSEQVWHLFYISLRN